MSPTLRVLVVDNDVSGSLDARVCVANPIFVFGLRVYSVQFTLLRWLSLFVGDDESAGDEWFQAEFAKAVSRV